MALELMLNRMIHQIKAQGATETQVAAYLTDWNNALEHIGKPLPCPLCHLKGESRRLKPISEERGRTVVRCECCRESFEFDSSEA